MPRIPVGMEYTATVEGRVAVDFDCASCGHAATALVRSSGEGTGTAWAFLGSEGAKNRATSGAEVDLKANAAVLAASAPCPKCGQIDGRSASSASNTALMQSIGVVVLSVFLAFVDSRRHDLAIVMPLIGVVVAVYSYQRASWKWTQARSRVRFVARGSAPLTQKSISSSHDDVSAQPPSVWATATSAVSTSDSSVPLSTVDPRVRTWTLCWLWKRGYEDVVSMPFAGSLRLGVLHKAGDENTWMEHSDLGVIPAAEALLHARKNLELASEPALRQVEPGVWQGDWGDWFAATRLVIAERFSVLDLDGDPIAFTPSENTLFVAGSRDEMGLVRAAQLAEAHAREVIANHPSAGAFCASPWLRGVTRLAPWNPPAGHPLHPHLEALSALVGEKGWKPPDVA